MAVVIERFGNGTLYRSGTGTNDNDQVFLTGDISEYDTFHLQSTAGAMDVFVSLDGTNFATAGYSLMDKGATTLDPVVVTSANRSYVFRGKFRNVKVLQNGATGVANAALMCGVVGSRS